MQSLVFQTYSFQKLWKKIFGGSARPPLGQDTVVPELMKISHSYLSDSKDQTIIEKVLLANDRGN